ncbi:phage/plasmid primase, P4 family [Streptomyces sp. DSM 44917]|uniref:Phage/plasmid primase, P4 family n=1 Tax=Streptomyces boetiae TaxID=3075541 RepID=A0ABU2LCG0_9ACTN|nr:phage/plasmid primase, P4 family [Streptomyces sp. DSM 44917]MDT0309271.1 phage/plasmid primase, P4 family [Streptomyces sp. DSM 44917]
MSAEEHASGPRLLPPPSNPMAVARALLAVWTRNGRLTLRYWRGGWMRWEATHWREVDDKEVRSWAYRELEHASCTVVNRKGEKQRRAWAPTKRKVADLMEATAAIAHLPAEINPPAWLYPPPAPSPRGPVVACRNGLLDVAGRRLLPLTPDFFTLVSVPFDYDPHATAPGWLAFLAQLWPDDPQSVQALQEWFGYVVSGRTDLQKILLIVGPTRSGKGTIARILTALVGKGNVAGPTLASLATNFGLSPLLGKPLAVISDARLSGRDGHQVVERLLTISGEDTIDVDRKYRDPWTGQLPSRFLILSNELPNFGDASGVIARRFVVLATIASWLGREDTALTGKLTAELPGILNWALEGLARLETSGRLSEPPASAEAVTTMQETASPMSAFVRECCETGPGREVTVEELWAAWRSWTEDNGIRRGSRQMFGRNLQAVVPPVRRTRPRGPDGQQVPTYAGITLTAPAAPHKVTGPDSARLSPDGPAVSRAESRPIPLRPPHHDTGTCAACGEPMTAFEPGQTTHPGCDTADRTD